jgi:hypothetical protein
MKEYIITEKQLNIFYNLCKEFPDIPNLDAAVRSRPLSEEQDRILDAFVKWDESKWSAARIKEYKERLWEGE